MTFINQFRLNNEARAQHVRFRAPSPIILQQNDTVVIGGSHRRGGSEFGSAFGGAFTGALFGSIMTKAFSNAAMSRGMYPSLDYNMGGCSVFGGGYPAAFVPTPVSTATPGLGLNVGAAPVLGTTAQPDTSATSQDANLTRLTSLFSGMRVVKEDDGTYTINTGKGVFNGTYDQVKDYMNEYLASTQNPQSPEVRQAQDQAAERSES